MKLVSSNIQYGFAVAVAARAAGDFHTHAKTIAGEVRGRRLDRCFVGGMAAGRVRAVGANMDETASDHFPLRIGIGLETPAGSGNGA